MQKTFKIIEMREKEKKELAKVKATRERARESK